MNLFFLQIYSFMSLSCSAMEVDAPHEAEVSKKGLSDAVKQSKKRKREGKQNLPLKNKSHPLESSESPVLTERLEERGRLLSIEINKGLESLGLITKELGLKILQARELAKENNNYKHVSELAGFVANTRSLNEQAQLLLKNLAPLENTEDENKVVNKSLAIIASSEFATRINQFIKAITQNYDTKEINFTQLVEVNREINQITADIDIKDKFVRLDKDK